MSVPAGNQKECYVEPEANVASNTEDCLRQLIGRRVVGVLVGQLPLNAKDIADHCTTFVLEDGRGFTFSSNGSHWLENRDDVRRAIDRKCQELERTKATLDDLLRVAGVHNAEDATPSAGG